MQRKDFVSALARPSSRIEPAHKRSAVAAIIDRHDELLLIRRTERSGDPWSGHLSFPGGRVEATDPDPLAAAHRETVEEIGLVLGREALVGSLDDLVAVGGAPGMVIHPYVFHDETLDIRALSGRFRPNTEVAAIQAWPIALLLAGTGRTTMEFVRGEQTWVLPCVDLDGSRLWGLTLRMVDDLLARLREHSAQ